MKKDDCYTAIDGGIYNLTPAIPFHKGGEQAMLNLCGKDGTAAFAIKHGSNDKAKAELATLQIGALR